MAFQEGWPLVTGRNQYIYALIYIVKWPFQRGWPLKRGSTVYYLQSLLYLKKLKIELT